jgi:hypothetical protein
VGSLHLPRSDSTYAFKARGYIGLNGVNEYVNEIEWPRKIGGYRWPELVE